MDVTAYCARVGHTGGLAPTLDTLRALHEAHAAAIPFENLDVLLGIPVGLDDDSLQRKLVAGRRGGYCFEQNLLFQGVLEALGFRTTALLGRVRFGRPVVGPRTHMALLVEVEGGQWLADVGFGGMGLVEPLPLVDGAATAGPVVRHRLRREGEAWVVEGHDGDDPLDLYAVTLEPQLRVDMEMAHHYTSTHPRSPFPQILAAQRVRRHERLVLRNAELTILREGGRERRTLGSAGEAEAVLRERFGLALPEGLRLPERLFQPAGA